MKNLNITRMNADFGNSIFMTMMDGYYFEIPTNVVEISKDKAEGYFASPADEAKELLNRLLISTEINKERRYFLIGEIAEKEILGNNHIKKLHNKAESHIPYVTFLAAVAYYHAIKGKTEDTHVEIDSFQTMLPIWLLKKLNKFSEMQAKMAERFLGAHELTIHTLGLEKKLTIEVKESKCRIEGEVARWAIKKNFDLEDNSDADQFSRHDVVLVDIGGGTVDLAMLPAGLQAPKNRDLMTFFTDFPYLSHLEDLRKEKLIEHFDEVRSLETFIVENINKSKMERKDGNSGKSYNLTEQIKNSLREYAKILITKTEDAFPAPKDKVYKYVYIGGVAPILEESVVAEVEERYNKDIAETNHIFLPEARKLNLYGLEILSRAEKSKQKQIATK